MSVGASPRPRSRARVGRVAVVAVVAVVAGCLSLLVACGAETGDGAGPQGAEPKLAAPEPAAPEPRVAAAPEPEPALEPSPKEPAPEPVTTTPFDPVLATQAIVRVVAVHRDHWAACGVFHSTGVIEVEVLEVGEPAPRMLLIVSCPVDFGMREFLVVDKLLSVSLFKSKQPWPTPPALRELPADQPRRWVKSMTEIDGVPPKNSGP